MYSRFINTGRSGTDVYVCFLDRSSFVSRPYSTRLASFTLAKQSMISL